MKKKSELNSRGKKQSTRSEVCLCGLIRKCDRVEVNLRIDQ